MANKDTIYQTVADTGNVDVSTITTETRLAEDLKLKSVDRISISAILSSKLGVEINMFEILKVKSVGDIMDLVEAKQGK